MTDFLANDIASFNSALAASKANDTILLSAGNYKGLSISNINKGGVINITSADPANMAVISDLKIGNSTGLNIEHVELTSGADPYYAARVGSSNNVTFNDIKFHGTQDGNPQNDIDGFLLQSDTNVNITNSEFYQLTNAVSHLNSYGVSIQNNSFHDIRTDGIHGGGTSNLLITRNSFTDFYPTTTDHPDAVQLWTINTTTSAQSIVIKDNLVVRGSGAPIQGIFMGDNTGGSLPFKGVTITGNTIVGGAYNGIYAANITNATITGNVVASNAGMASWIRADHIASGLFSSNSAAQYVVSANGWTVGANTTTGALVTDGGKSLVGSWLNSKLASVTSLSDSLLGLTGNRSVDVSGSMKDDDIVIPTGYSAITGGVGDDVFTAAPVYRSPVHATITDFGHYGDHDVLNLSAYVDAGLAPVIRSLGGNTVLIFGNFDVITLENVNASTIRFSGGDYFVG